MPKIWHIQYFRLALLRLKSMTFCAVGNLSFMVKAVGRSYLLQNKGCWEVWLLSSNLSRLNSEKGVVISVRFIKNDGIFAIERKDKEFTQKPFKFVMEWKAGVKFTFLGSICDVQLVTTDLQPIIKGSVQHYDSIEVMNCLSSACLSCQLQCNVAWKHMQR